MAFTRTLPEDVLRTIADQVAARIRVAPADAHSLFMTESVSEGENTLNLGESFQVWTLIKGFTNEVANGNLELSSLARESGVWHHQIRSNEIAGGFARSQALGPTADSWSLRELFSSPLAESIDEAIAWVDENIPDEVEVRLLSVPFQQVEAFWFVTQQDSPLHDTLNDFLLILMAPEHLGKLVPLTLVSSSEFLRSIANPTRGMGFNPGTARDDDQEV